MLGCYGFVSVVIALRIHFYVLINCLLCKRIDEGYGAGVRHCSAAAELAYAQTAAAATPQSLTPAPLYQPLAQGDKLWVKLSLCWCNSAH